MRRPPPLVRLEFPSRRGSDRLPDHFTSRLGSIRTAAPDFVVQEHGQLYFAINGTDTTGLRDQLANPPKMEE